VTSRLRGRLALIVALLVLIALLATAAHPTVRARYHLRRVSPAEITFEKKGLRLDGHAKAFAESSAARDLLPEIVERALEEAERDQVLLYRALVFAIVKDGDPLTNETLSVFVRSLDAENPAVQSLAWDHLPLEPRTLAVHIESLESLCKMAEGGTAFAWTVESVKKSYVRFARLAANQGYTDSPWDEIVSWESFWAMKPTIVSVTPREPDLATARKLKTWLEKNRAKLPEQVR
ncbi:MAG: hypothetical protein ACAI25_17035, partial [Planctomycetota bacterium]